jgi:hypothetical protein
LLSQHLATRELYSISKELNMPAETLIEQDNPDLTPAFKEWLVAELRKHYEHEQRSQQAAAQQQQQQSPQVPAAISSDACAMRDGGSWGSLEGDGKASEEGREGELSKHNKHEQLPHQAVAQPAQEARLGQAGIDSDTAPTRPSADQPQENPQQQQQQQQQQQTSEQVMASTPAADKAARRAAGSATTPEGAQVVIDSESPLTQSPGQAGLVARAVNAVGRLIWSGSWGQ